MRSRSISLAAILAVTAILVSCGVPTSGDFRPIAQSELPFDLGKAASTSTTSTTTTIPIDGAVIQLYFVLGSSLQPEARVVVEEVDPTIALRMLIIGPSLFPATGAARTALPSDLNVDVKVEKGVASVNTSIGLLTDVPAADQILAVGQMVLTLTSLPGIGQVRFTVNGRPQSVPRGGGDLTAPGAEVSFDDYIGLTGVGSQ